MRDSFERKIDIALKCYGWKCNTTEGMLMLLELMVKKQNGCYNSYTEGGFLDSMKVLTKGNKPNKLGREFMMHMIYASSNNKAPIFNMIKEHRN